MALAYAKLVLNLPINVRYVFDFVLFAECSLIQSTPDSKMGENDRRRSSSAEQVFPAGRRVWSCWKLEQGRCPARTVNVKNATITKFIYILEYLFIDKCRCGNFLQSHRLLTTANLWESANERRWESMVSCLVSSGMFLHDMRVLKSYLFGHAGHEETIRFSEPARIYSMF